MKASFIKSPKRGSFFARSIAKIDESSAVDIARKYILDKPLTRQSIRSILTL